MSKPTILISERRLAANRANARRSTGPRTPEGKAASARNAVKHGFRSSSFAVVRLEELDEVARLKADALSCYRPVNAQELFAVEQIALAQHQMLRGARLEAGLFTDAMNAALDIDGDPIKPMDEKLVGATEIEICRAQNRNYCLAEGFHRMAKEANSFSLMLRYQAQAERMYRRALEDFKRLKALRDELPNEPNVGTQPEEKEELLQPKDITPGAAKNPAPPVPRSGVHGEVSIAPAKNLQPAPKPSLDAQNTRLPEQIKPAA